MILIKNTSTEPYFNMACEEYLLQISSEPTVMLWRNEPAVIIGKNQNARENVDFDFTKEHNIKVVRRLTGGGAVFHDLGNVNYTFIIPKSDAPAEFSAFSEPIISALKALGINAECSGRNDLLSGGKKFSGTARCEYRQNDKTLVMHHGTLLFSSDMAALVGALKVDPEKIKSKGIKSTSARVINLRELLPAEKKTLSVTDFIDYLSDYFIGEGASPREFSDDEREKISALANEKYKTDEWLFRAGAEDFDVSRGMRFGFGSVKISLSCAAGDVGEKPTIRGVLITGDFFGDGDISELEKMLAGTVFSADAVSEKLRGTDIGKYIRGATVNDIIKIIFN